MKPKMVILAPIAPRTTCADLALFHELAEAGVNERLGFLSPADLVDRYPAFFWGQAASQNEPAVGHVSVTTAWFALAGTFQGHKYARLPVQQRGNDRVRATCRTHESRTTGVGPWRNPRGFRRSPR